LADFFFKPRLNRVGHEAIGLLGASIYLLSNAPLLFEMQIRSDAVCMFFQILNFWLIIQFFYYRVISPNARKPGDKGYACVEFLSRDCSCRLVEVETRRIV